MFCTTCKDVGRMSKRIGPEEYVSVDCPDCLVRVVLGDRFYAVFRIKREVRIEAPRKVTKVNKKKAKRKR